MCSLSIINSSNKFIITHNRDEKISRHYADGKLAMRKINNNEVYMPLDAEKGGTWIASDGQKAAALINGFQKNHVRRAPYKKSRGLIVPSIFEYTDVATFFDYFDPRDYEPFTLIIAQANSSIIEIGWDHTNLNISYLSDYTHHFYSSPTLYDESIRKNRQKMFFDSLGYDFDEQKIWSIHQRKGDDFNNFLNVDYNDQIRTVAITQISLGSENKIRYQSLTSKEAEVFAP
jgi:hypothetical protein